jgi:cathepsin L|eukprot:TRINITY_DN1497_c0_g2_i1.p1 TRINITY_DN1497_c0_g2~~TRINITY_DN1497_c0_g2_i1.p1  ORF type:complete len:367 (+),score=42.92 TRINITY_DN1497_c0_g2_i1:78-1178(+)
MMKWGCAFVACASAIPDSGENNFVAYIQEFRKQYSSEEVRQRQEVFENNFKQICDFNADTSKTWFASVNEFTDWTNDEFRARRLGKIPDAKDEHNPLEVSNVDITDLPKEVDWRNKGVVTPPKNQGGCGSCWAFSATETLESHLAIATGNPPPVLSPQQIVSCAPNPQHCGGTGGCQGSTQPLAFNYTRGIGITTEESYSYEGVTGTCDTRKIDPVAINDGFVKLKVNDYTALLTAVATKGPIAISVAAGGLEWQLYGGGVLTSCGFVQDHAVQLVGYGVDGNKEFWLVRNSWGSGWGERGYIRIQRFGEGKEPCGIDKKPGDGDACEGDTTPRTYCGMCGILSSSSYPTGVRELTGWKTSYRVVV